MAEEEKEERRKEYTRTMRHLEDGQFIKLYEINENDKHYIIEVVHTILYYNLTSFCAA